jgi:hypothetical protein
MSPAAPLHVPSDLVARYDVPGPRYTSYPTAARWTNAVGPAAHAAALERLAARGAGAPLSLYVHLPFCRSLCLYCACNVVVARDAASADPYLDDLEREIDRVAERLGDRRRVAQLHWGGGTPTFLDPPRLERVWRDLMGRFALLPDAEASVEIDPRVTSAEQLALLRDLGFGRLSIGRRTSPARSRARSAAARGRRRIAPTSPPSWRTCSRSSATGSRRSVPAQSRSRTAGACSCETSPWSSTPTWRPSVPPPPRGRSSSGTSKCPAPPR